MKSSTTSILLTITLISVSLAGCSEKEEGGPFLLTVVNTTGHVLQKNFKQGEGGGGSLALGPYESSGTNFGCPEDLLGPEWEFTLQLRHKEGPVIGPVFAEGSFKVSCDAYTAWIHPDGYIVWEEGDSTWYDDKKGHGNIPHIKLPPWERGDST